jgi:hypothetical protein
MNIPLLYFTFIFHLWTEIHQDLVKVIIFSRVLKILVVE